jgi:hypothetical protein
MIKVLMAQDLFPDASRELAWGVTEMNDADLQIAFLKVLSGSASDMKINDRKFFLDKVDKLDRADIIDRHIQLVREICTTMRDKDEQSDKIIYQSLQLLWKMAMESEDSFDLANVNRAAFAFSAIIEKQGISVKLEYIEKLAANLKNNKLGSLSLKTLTGILSTSNK